MALESQSRSLPGVYGISVMSELTGAGPQPLHLYERRGLLTPTRTGGGTSRYSESDLETLRRITGLVDDGVNLVGVRLILSLEAETSVRATRIVQLSESVDIENPGNPTASRPAIAALQQLAFFEGLGAVILFFGAAAVGRLSLRSHRDIRRAQRPVETDTPPLRGSTTSS